jgi:putative transposase
MVPAMVHYGHTDQVYLARQRVLKAAFENNPDRFVRAVSNPPTVPDTVWINKPRCRSQDLR